MPQETTLQGHETLEKIGNPVQADGRVYTLYKKGSDIFYLLQKRGDIVKPYAELFRCDELRNGKSVYRFL
jgi:hypothetical protein